LLGLGMDDAIDREFRGEPPTHPRQSGDPHSPNQRVGDRHRAAIADSSGQQDRCDVLGERPDQRIGLVQKAEPEILEPANEHDVADNAGKVYVVSPYRERLFVILAHRPSGSPGLAPSFASWV
jgi:hypothetical protein